MRITYEMHSNGVLEVLANVDHELQKGGMRYYRNVCLRTLMSWNAPPSFPPEAIEKFSGHGLWHLHVVGPVLTGDYRVPVRREVMTLKKMLSKKERELVCGLLLEKAQ